MKHEYAASAVVCNPIRSWLFNIEYITPSGSLDLSPLSLSNGTIHLPSMGSSNPLQITYVLSYVPDTDALLLLWKNLYVPCLLRVTLFKPDATPYKLYEVHGVQIRDLGEIILDWSMNTNVTRTVVFEYSSITELPIDVLLPTG